MCAKFLFFGILELNFKPKNMQRHLLQLVEKQFNEAHLV